EGRPAAAARRSGEDLPPFPVLVLVMFGTIKLAAIAIAALVITNGANHYLTKWFAMSAGKRAGIEQCEREHREASEKERARQARVEATETAKTRMVIERLDAAVARIDQTLQENENEASADPDSDDCGLS